MGSHTVVDIVKTVAPIALDALIKSAENLAGQSSVQRQLASALGNVGAQLSGGRLALAVSDGPPDSSQLFNDLTEAATTLWQDRFYYFYKGNGSQCLVGNKITRAINSGSDLVIYDKSQGQQPDVKGYLTKIFEDTALSDQATIELVNNLNGIIQARWTEESLDWTPLTKSYANLQGGDGSTMNIDMLLYTACAADATNNLAGLAFYMFTYYPSPASA